LSRCWQVRDTRSTHLRASAGVCGKVEADRNLLGRFGVHARIEAAAQVAALPRLEISFEAERPIGSTKDCVEQFDAVIDVLSHALRLPWEADSSR
jgi:hypothetical protein